MNNVKRNIFASILPQFVNVISNLILPGMIILQFGSEINGLVSTTKTIVFYISIVGAGIATSVTQALYAPVAKGNIHEIKGMLHAADNMFKKYGYIYILLTIVIAIIYPYMLKTDIPDVTIALLLLVMSISGASEFFVTGRCMVLLYAKQRVYIYSIIQAVSLSLSLIFAVIMLKLRMSIVSVQLAISFVYIFRAVFLQIYINKCYPELKDFNDVPPIEKTVSKRKDAMIHQLSGLIVTGSQSIILSSFVGLKAASIYAVYNIVFSGLQSICANINNSITPYIGRELSLKRLDLANSIYNKIEFAFFGLATFIFSVAIIMINPFVKLYTQGSDMNYVYVDFSILFAYSSMFYILKMPSTAAINAAGHFRETRLRAIIEASLCLFFGILFSILVGRNGILIGTFIALFWRCIDTILYSNKYIFKLNNRRSFKRLCMGVGITVVSVLFSHFVQFEIDSYVEWTLYACIASGLIAVLLIFSMLMIDRETMKEMLRSILKLEGSKNEGN